MSFSGPAVIPSLSKREKIVLVAVALPLLSPAILAVCTWHVGAMAWWHIKHTFR